MDEKEIEFLSLRERIRELEQRIHEKQMLINQRDEMISRMYEENEHLKDQFDNLLNERKVCFGTRNQDGLTKEYAQIHEAVKDFASYDGYRLDIMIENYPNIHIYRDELPSLGEDESLSMFTQMNCVDYKAKVVIYRTMEE